MSHQQDCSICAELHHRIEKNLWHLWRENSMVDCRVIAQSQHFVAMPSLGQLVPGYTLICSRGHELSIARSIQDRAVRFDLEIFLADVEKLLQERFARDTLVFEHGAAEPGSAIGCSVDHAHLHVVPFGRDIADVFISDNRHWISCPQLVDLATASEWVEGYLYYRGINGSGLIARAASTVPSQYFRRILASAAGEADRWDWRLYPAVRGVNTAALLMQSRTVAGSR